MRALWERLRRFFSPRLRRRTRPTLARRRCPACGKSLAVIASTDALWKHACHPKLPFGEEHRADNHARPAEN
jgi:hypothetical protein